MRPNFHNDPDARQKNEAFEVGMRVKVISPMVDFYAFRGETGTVESNSGGYLGIIVRFDEPRRFNNGHVQEWFNFNYYDLEPLRPAADANPVREAVQERERMLIENGDLRRQLAEKDAALDRMTSGYNAISRQLAEAQAENLRIQVDNAKLRFYVAELEAESRTIDMHLAQQAAREKYEAAFGDQAD